MSYLPNALRAGNLAPNVAFFADAMPDNGPLQGSTLSACWGSCVASVTGTLTVQGVPPARYFSGGASTSVSFPRGFLSNAYTLVHVTRFAKYATENDAIWMDDAAWRSGFVRGTSGSVSHEGTPHVIDRFPLAWVVSVDQRGMYVANGIKTAEFASRAPPPPVVGINLSAKSGSAFDWGCTLMYTRELSDAEVRDVSKILGGIFGVTIYDTSAQVCGEAPRKVCGDGLCCGVSGTCGDDGATCDDRMGAFFDGVRAPAQKAETLYLCDRMQTLYSAVVPYFGEYIANKTVGSIALLSRASMDKLREKQLIAPKYYRSFTALSEELDVRETHGSQREAVFDRYWMQMTSTSLRCVFRMSIQKDVSGFDSAAYFLRALDALAYIPNEYIVLLQLLSRSGGQGVVFRKLDTEGLAGFATTDGKALVVDYFYNVAGVLLHELSHVLTMYYCFSKNGSVSETCGTEEWYKPIYPFEPPTSEYGNAAFTEDMAEFGTVYALASMLNDAGHMMAHLQRMSPRRHKWWSAALAVSYDEIFREAVPDTPAAAAVRALSGMPPYVYALLFVVVLVAFLT